jgi:hypothetical protein
MRWDGRRRRGCKWLRIILVVVIFFFAEWGESTWYADHQWAPDGDEDDDNDNYDDGDE